MIRAFVLGAALMLCAVGDHAVLAQGRADNCDPRFRRDPIATSRAREAKKAEMRAAGFPERLLQLLDRYECVACIENASDDFHITILYHDDDRAPTGVRGGRIKMRGFRWDPVTERGAREDLAAGRIKAFYIVNTASRCRCCPDDPNLRDEDYADWRPDLDLHMGQAIAFEDPRGLGPLPPDLVNPPRSWLERVPAIQRYEKPGRRVVQVLCRACQSIADRWNSAAATLDSLWDDKVTLLDGLSIARNALATRRNEISRLQYRQLFTATASPENPRRIDELRRMNEDQEAGMDRDERRLEGIERSIREQQQRMDAFLKELQDCEAKCKTTAATADAPTAVTPSTPESPQTSPSPPGVSANARPQPAGTPGPAQPVCPDCAAAAADMARLRAEHEARLTAGTELRNRQATNAGNIQNLVALRAEAARRGNTARVTELERRISDIQAANRQLREEEFRNQQAIEQLIEAEDKVSRELDACNRRCAVTDPQLSRYLTTPPGGMEGPPKRTVGVNPITPVAACKECEGLANQLQAAHAELVRLAEHANALGRDEAYEDFEEQRVKVEQLQRQLEACNRKCATTTITEPAPTMRTPPVTTAASPAPAPVGGVPSAPVSTGAPPATPVPPASLPAPGGGAGVSPPPVTADAPMTGGSIFVSTPATTVDPVHAACPECQGTADRVAVLERELAILRAAHDQLEIQLGRLAYERNQMLAAEEVLAQRVRAGAGPEFKAALDRSRRDRAPLDAKVAGGMQTRDEWRQAMAGLAKEIAAARAQLDACNARCRSTSEPDRASCTGSGCGEMWRACADLNTCPKIDEDCRVPGACVGGVGDGGPPLVDVFDPNVWGTSGNVEIEISIQVKMTDVFDPIGAGQGPPAEYFEVPPTLPQQVREWFNPLGLLARRIGNQIERWRGSVGPRPLLTRRDIELAEPYTSGQAMGLPKGVHLLLTDRGGSTGKTLGLQVLNLTGKPVRLAPMPFAIEPIRQQAQARVRQAFNRLAKAAPVNVDLAAYCVEFLKLPPAANQIFRLAPANIQKKYESMSKVLRSAYRVQHAGLLRPDSNPAAYTDSIKQWAVWAVEQRLNEPRFTAAFLSHTKKNVEAAGQQWSKPAEDMVRKVSPNRWRDILKVLQGAGLPVPQ